MQWRKIYGEAGDIIRTIESNLLDFIILSAFREYKQDTFHEELLKIYEQGCFPCGWKGAYPEGKIVIW
ncbi:hypothetical protein [Clostridium cagae]|uniref:hypothetical protein n=1 Tax=Clostridium cagae TaxID=2080751 RepID=UPI000CF715E4|nr:hypothetical protein [Clostridium cagae]